MDLTPTPEERAFLAELREFLRDELPPHIRDRVACGLPPEGHDLVTWQRILHARGWGAPHWPVEHGGTGWGPRQRLMFQRELLKAAAPEPHGLNMNLVGPVLIRFGNAEQQRRFLPRLLTMDMIFCQGFSEPEAGSDLAAVRTTARLDGDHYIVNGQKTWTSFARQADWIFCLVRTDSTAAKPQLGISFLLVELNSPGITQRPISTIDGEAHLNEIFFEDVRVPAANLVGEPNRGWDYAKYLLVNERVGIARTGRTRERLRRAKTLAIRTHEAGAALIDQPGWRRRIAEIEAQLAALEVTELRMASAADPGSMDTLGAILKLRGSELQQAANELLCEMGGLRGLRMEPEHNGEEEDPDWLRSLGAAYFYSRSQSIFGGTNEIQRNIIAKASLGLR